MRSISSTPWRTSFMVSQISGSGATNGPAALGVGGRASSMTWTWPLKAEVASAQAGAALVCHAPIGAESDGARVTRAMAEPDAERVVGGARRCDGDDGNGVTVDVGGAALVIGIADFHVGVGALLIAGGLKQI